MPDAQAGMFPKQVLEWLPLVSGRIIQQNNDRASEMPRQLTQKPLDPPPARCCQERGDSRGPGGAALHSPRFLK